MNRHPMDRPESESWLVRSALGGGALWVALAAGACAGIAPLGAIEALFLLGPLVVVPLALLLLDRARTPGSRARADGAARVLLPFAGAAAAASFLLPAGAAAASLAGVWLLFTLCVGAGGVQVLRALVIARGPWRGPRDAVARASDHADRACVLAARFYLPVGGAFLLLSRAGATPMGFLEPIVLLTALHYHFAAFAAPVIAGAAGAALGAASFLRRAAYPVIAAGVIAGPAVLATGWTARSPILKVMGAMLLVASQIGFAVLLFRASSIVGRSVARVLLAVSAASLLVGMTLAGLYAAGEFRELGTLTIAQMARIHGVANGLGFTLCGLLGFCLAPSSLGYPTPGNARQETPIPASRTRDGVGRSRMHLWARKE